MWRNDLKAGSFSKSSEQEGSIIWQKGHGLWHNRHSVNVSSSSVFVLSASRLSSTVTKT